MGPAGWRGARGVRADGLALRVKRGDKGQVRPEIRAHELGGTGWEVIILGDGGWWTGGGQGEAGPWVPA